MDFSKLIEWVKLSPRYLLPLSLVAGFLLFANTSLLEIFGLLAFVSNFRSWIGLVFLVATSLILVDVMYQSFWWFSEKIKILTKRRTRHQRLTNLTLEEKDILLGYLIPNTRTQFFPINDGVVLGLEAEEIIYRSSALGSVDSWSFNIQPWAWKMLNENKDEIFTREDIENYENLKSSPSKRSRIRAGYGY